MTTSQIALLLILWVLQVQMFSCHGNTTTVVNVAVTPQALLATLHFSSDGSQRKLMKIFYFDTSFQNCMCYHAIMPS